MKLITDPRTNSNHIVLENYQPNAMDTKIMTQFVSEAMNTHETIGGIFYTAHDGKQHTLEIQNQGLYAFLLTIHSLGARVPLQISFDDAPAPARMWAKFWNVPEVIIKFLQFFGFCGNNSFKQYFEYVKRYPRKNISYERSEHIPQ